MRRIWSVADVAAHIYGERTPAACVRARRLLLRLQAQHPATRFLESSGGRCYRINVGALARCAPDLFAPVKALEPRVEELADELAELRANQRRIVSQVGANTRSIERLRGR